jgi:hypothetical protein
VTCGCGIAFARGNAKPLPTSAQHKVTGVHIYGCTVWVCRRTPQAYGRQYKCTGTQYKTEVHSSRGIWGNLVEPLSHHPGGGEPSADIKARFQEENTSGTDALPLRPEVRRARLDTLAWPTSNQVSDKHQEATYYVPKHKGRGL